jgi:hypothetical protein
MSRYGFHARAAREATYAGADAHAQARLFRGLLAETDAALRQAWAAGRIPAGVLSDDLIERTRAALAGETTAKPLTVTEAIADAASELSALGGHRL